MVSIVAVVMLRRQPLPQPPTLVRPSAQLPAHAEIKGAEISHEDEAGNVLWRLKAGGKADYDQQARITTAADVRWEFFSSGQPTIVIEAPVFVGDYPQRELGFGEGVLIHTADGQQTFEAQRVTYQFDSHELLLEQPRLVKGRYEITGARAVLDIAEEQLHLTGGVRLTRS